MGIATMAITPVPEQPYTEIVKDRFDEARDSSDRVVFTNRGSSEARVLLKELFHSATHSLEIYTRCLNNEVYDPRLLIATARRLPAGGVRILVADHRPGESSALYDLSSEGQSGLIRVKQFREAADHSTQPSYQPFAICDGKHFRIEKDHFSKTAVVVLNGAAEPLAKDYTELFEDLWNRSDPYDWPRLNAVTTAAVA
jgi:hypothetical protein